MSTSRSKSDGAPGSVPLEDLPQPKEALTAEQAEQVRGGAAIKGALTDVCTTPKPSGPVPIPYPN